MANPLTPPAPALLGFACTTRLEPWPPSGLLREAALALNCAAAGCGVGGGAGQPAGMLREELGDPWDFRMAMEDWAERRWGRK
jgi:hypothetical protein